MKKIVIVLVAAGGALILFQAVRLFGTGMASEGAVAYEDFEKTQHAAFQTYLSGLRKDLKQEGLTPDQAQDKLDEKMRVYGQGVLEDFLAFRGTEEGKRHLEAINGQILSLAIQVVGNHQVVEDLLRSYADGRERWDMMTDAADMYAQVGNAGKAGGLMNQVMRESQAKDPEYHDRAKTLLFQIAPEGRPFPEFPEGTRDVAGKPIKLSDYKGKIVLIDFWASWCGPCMQVAPSVVEAYTKYHPKGFEIIGISLDKTREAMDGAARSVGMTWRQYFDGLGWDNAVGRFYGIASIPTLFLIDENGRVIAKNVHHLDPILEKRLGAVQP